jgi:hypothetical protein
MSFAHLLTDTVTVAAPNGVSSSGDPAFAAATTVKARVERGSKTVYGPSGTQLQSEAVIYTETEIALGSRVWLPGDNIGSAAAAKRPLIIGKVSAPGGGLTLCKTHL